MKRFLSFLLILAVVLSMTGGRSCAGEAENVWNNTVMQTTNWLIEAFLVV